MPRNEPFSRVFSHLTRKHCIFSLFSLFLLWILILIQIYLSSSELPLIKITKQDSPVTRVCKKIRTSSRRLAIWDCTILIRGSENYNHQNSWFCFTSHSLTFVHFARKTSLWEIISLGALSFQPEKYCVIAIGRINLHRASAIASASIPSILSYGLISPLQTRFERPGTNPFFHSTSKTAISTFTH